MPYILNSVVEVITTATESVALSVPEGHMAGDLLLAFATQDTGSTNIVATGWTDVGPQAEAQGQRTAVLYKIATSDSEVFSAIGTTEEWAISLMVIRGADPVTPIEGYVRTDSADSLSATLASGSVTTTRANCLMLYCAGWDNIRKMVPDLDEVLAVTRSENSAGCVQITGYFIQKAAGASPIVTTLSEVSNEGGTAWIVAIADANPATPKLPPYVNSSMNYVGRYGGTPNPASTGLAFIRHDEGTFEYFNGVAATTIAGIAVPAVTSSYSGGTLLSSATWGSFTITNASSGSAGWCGFAHNVSAKNLSDKVFSVEFALDSVAANVMGVDGFIVYFQDSGGNWAAYRATKNLGLYSVTAYRVFIATGRETPLDSGGTIDWANIVKVGYAAHRLTSTLKIYVRCPVILDRVVALGGCAESPASFFSAAGAMSSWAPSGLVKLQGGRQTLIHSSLQVGNGTDTTYFSSFGGSLELPAKEGAALNRRLWKVGELDVGVTIKASANDTILLGSSVVTSLSKQQFTIDPASSPSATYSFIGLVLVGWVVSLQASGVVVKGASFSRCYTITLAGGELYGCNVDGALESPAVLTSFPSNVIDCSFTQGDLGGHAIEITQPGAFAFVGNTFEGYGLDGTTDAAIYNNSGGHVVLNVSGGGDTPTVRNGVGATTEVVSGAQVTVVGLATGSQVKVTKVSDGSVLFNGAETLGQVSFSTTYIGAVRVDARKASASPFYKPWATQATTISGQTVEVTALQELDE